MIRVGWRLTAHRKEWLGQCKDELLQFRAKLSRPMNPNGYNALSDQKLYDQFFNEANDFSKKNLLWPFVLIILTESTMQSLLSLLRSVFGDKADSTLRTWMAHGINTVTFEMNEGFKQACLDASKRTQFLSAYGHRGQGELDLSKKRWVEKGAQAFEQFETRALLRPPVAQAVQKSVEEEILALDTFKKDLILTEWKYLKSMLELREHWKMEILKPYAEIRFMALELGRRTGLGDDIFWLRLSEIAKYKSDLKAGFNDKLSAKVLERKTRFHAFKNFHFPEYIQLSEIDDLLSDKPKSREAVLEGQAISPGLVFGTVCVVHDYDEVDLAKWPEDAILVADATDPGWTPLFVRSKAIVVARGGALSHCAIVAREMNLPAVSEVASCTSLLQDGMKIWVDGNLGRVILESKSS
jgi:phosphohistidine swiveling domain-containing protein